MGRTAKIWFWSSRKCWYVNHNGKQVQLSADKDEALKLWSELKQGTKTSSTTGLKDLINIYKERRTKSKPVTIQRRNIILDSLIQFFGNADPSQINLNSWIDSNKSWKESTKKYASNTVRYLFKWLHLNNYCNRRLHNDWSCGRNISRGKETVINVEQQQAILAKCKPQYKQVIKFLLLTGCRPKELCDIQSEHVYLDKSLIVLPAHKQDKSGRPRLIVLNNEAKELIQHQLELNPVGYVFRNSQGNRLFRDTLTRYCSYLRIRAKTAFLAYGCRHTFATAALLSGLPETIVAALLGHTGTSNLHLHYSHLDSRTEQLKAWIERIEKEQKEPEKKENEENNEKEQKQGKE